MLHTISSERLSLDRVAEIIEKGFKIELSDESIQKIQKCRTYLDEKVKTHPDPIYGINTGFGSLCDTSISNEDLGLLQKNLVMSHACGMGQLVPQEIVKMMILLKVQGLSYGHSGVQIATVERLIELFNNDIIPVVYQLGSLGASGDLSPLAHMSLAILGLGEVYYKGERRYTQELYAELGWRPIELKSKEGLALLNGTQFMSAYGTHSVIRMARLSIKADMIGAISLEAYDGRINPFNENVNLVRAQKGQLKTAKIVRDFVEGSEIITQKKAHVQDPYSYRCMPQVHGASKDTLVYVSSVIENEINSVTDNPTIFPDEDEIVSAGNFHGQPLAVALDNLSIAIAELGSISERRTFKLLGGERGLPAYLVAKPGLNSGFMIPQYTAASIVSQNRQLSTPCSVDSIDSSNGQEDHVSMGANAATKTFKIIDNLERILGIELLNAAQGLEFRRPLKSSARIENLLSDYRKEIDFVEDDVVMYPLMHKSADFVKSWKVEKTFTDYLLQTHV